MLKTITVVLLWAWNISPTNPDAVESNWEGFQSSQESPNLGTANIDEVRACTALPVGHTEEKEAEP